MKPRPNPGWMGWVDAAATESLYLSVVSIAEIRYGIERLAPGVKRDRLDAWLSLDLPRRFDRRLLGIDEAVADAWGRIVAGRAAAGRVLASADAYLAATAAVHELTLVTRNVADFEGSVADMVNPWSEA